MKRFMNPGLSLVVVIAACIVLSGSILFNVYQHVFGEAAAAARPALLMQETESLMHHFAQAEQFRGEYLATGDPLALEAAEHSLTQARLTTAKKVLSGSDHEGLRENIIVLDTLIAMQLRVIESARDKDAVRGSAEANEALTSSKELLLTSLIHHQLNVVGELANQYQSGEHPAGNRLESLRDLHHALTMAAVRSE